MKDLNLDDVNYEPTEDELDKYRLILEVQQQEFQTNSDRTKLALDCIYALTKLIDCSKSGTQILFSDVLQSAIEKQLTKFVKALSIDGDNKTTKEK